MLRESDNFVLLSNYVKEIDRMRDCHRLEIITWGSQGRRGRCILITRIHTHCGDRFMSKGTEIVLGVFPSDMNKYIRLMCAENQIVTYCYLLH